MFKITYLVIILAVAIVIGCSRLTEESVPSPVSVLPSVVPSTPRPTPASTPIPIQTPTPTPNQAPVPVQAICEDFGLSRRGGVSWIQEPIVKNGRLIMKGNMDEPPSVRPQSKASGFQLWSANYAQHSEDYLETRMNISQLFKENDLYPILGISAEEFEANVRQIAEKPGPHFLHTIVNPAIESGIQQNASRTENPLLVEYLHFRYIYPSVWKVDDQLFHIEFDVPAHLKNIPLAVLIGGKSAEENMQLVMQGSHPIMEAICVGYE